MIPEREASWGAACRKIELNDHLFPELMIRHNLRPTASSDCLVQKIEIKTLAADLGNFESGPVFFVPKAKQVSQEIVCLHLVFRTSSVNMG